MNPSLVTTPLGRLSGLCTGGIHRFLGVPYARPPVGPLRLRSPQPPLPWTGIRPAHDAGAASLQTLAGQQQWLNAPIEHLSEDCLFLNVWTPSLTGRHPVMVWIHGGQTRNGHGASPASDGQALAALGVVVVTINYRLGALGGLAHPGLEDPATGFCANWGLQDKLAALAWVAEHIGAFGGDPGRVTLAGQSSGAANAVMLAQNSLASGHFHALIAQSPPLFRPPMFAELADAAAYTEALARRLGVAVPALRQVAGSVLQTEEQALARTLTAEGRRPHTAPVRDGRLLRHWPFDAPAIGVPLLAGWTRHEADFWFHLQDGQGHSLAPLREPDDAAELAPRVQRLMAQHYAFTPAPDTAAVLDAYTASGGVPQRWRDLYTDLVFRAPILQLINRQAAHGQPAWAYEFAYPLPGDRPSTPHAADVPFVFGTHRHPHLAPKIGATGAADALSATVIRAWADFVHHGAPGPVNGTAWPRFTAAQPLAMVLEPAHPGPAALSRPAGLACWPAYTAPWTEAAPAGPDREPL
ncbi:carboxylesterase/lipase family protein [Hydrogenophaga sp. NFH-34]|uniref:carboxylesterase/lipase family protein n=1 Tax=Hydrogenophaga sp. NFH-34 TaxID=2744446 RepID=UPI001F45167D|nr:carboxylesterase family protein [Hydrogenophaga sp. NFH-34]